MINTKAKSTVNVRIDEQLTDLIKRAIKNKPSIKLDTDSEGNIIIDPEKQPQVYDWAVNG